MRSITLLFSLFLSLSMNISCGSDDTEDSPSVDNADASANNGCTVADNGDGTFNINCGGSVVTVQNGVNGVNGVDGEQGIAGIDGQDGEPGLNGENCTAQEITPQQATTATIATIASAITIVA